MHSPTVGRCGALKSIGIAIRIPGMIVLALLAAGVAGAAPIHLLRTQPATEPHAALVQLAAVAAFEAQARRRALDQDRSQDISPTQLLALLDVAERTGYSLGQLLATGEHESAHTWNDFVRPRLSSGRLGRAAGVWQFQPKTFERIIHLYGTELLALTAADPAAGRRRLDLGFGPFCDSHVRLVIRDTMAGLRDPSDPELKLLRHNFTILALAKYLLSKDSGATNPVEDYLFHFLGPAQGRRILALAQGDARHTRTVKPPPPPDPPTAAGGTSRVRDTLPGRPELLLELAPRGYRSLMPGAPTPGARAADAMLRRQDEPAPKPPQPPPPQWRADYGYPHDSPVVTSNAGMFYRDGQARSDPYTWAEFLRHLERRVKADRQPELVRAKYGVGFYLEGGDMPHRAFNPDAPGSGDGATLSVRLDDGTTRDLLRAQILEPLDTREMRDYQRRLAALIGLGDAEPTAVLSDAAALALWRLGLLEPPSHATEPAADPADLLGTDMGLGWGTVLRTDEPAVRRALQAFRSLVGKAAPEHPAHSDLLLPAERVALEVYGARIERMLAAERTD